VPRPEVAHDTCRKLVGGGRAVATGSEHVQPVVCGEADYGGSPGCDKNRMVCSGLWEASGIHRGVTSDIWWALRGSC
jgi:hypothetical protein